jgi:hypothetical protein
MIAFLEELMAKLFGAEETLPVRVRADEGARPQDRQLKGRK